jgi:hypothetical protein
VARDPSPSRIQALIAVVQYLTQRKPAMRCHELPNGTAAGLRWHDIIAVDPKLATWELRYGIGVNNQHWNRLASLHWKVVPGDRAPESDGPESA